VPKNTHGAWIFATRGHTKITRVILKHSAQRAVVLV
jgi:hypothetical protein